MGFWVLVNALLGLSRAADFWSRGLSSFIGEARGKGETNNAAGFVTTAVSSGVLGYALLATLGTGAVHVFAELLVGAERAETAREIVPLMGLVFWTLSIAGIYQAGFLAFGRPELKAVQTTGGAALFLAFALWLAPKYGLWGILMAQAIQAGGDA